MESILFTGCLKENKDLVVNTKEGVRKIDMRTFYISFKNKEFLLNNLEYLINNNELEWLKITDIK